MPVPKGPCEAGTPANRRIGSGIPRSVGPRCESLMGSSRVGTHRACSGREVEVMTGRAELRPAGKGMVAAVGGLLFGYDWVVIGGAKPFYEKFFQLRDAPEQGWAMSCALIGCLLGAVISGSLSDRYGRKRLLILAALFFGVSSAGTALA